MSPPVLGLCLCFSLYFSAENKEKYNFERSGQKGYSGGTAGGGGVLTQSKLIILLHLQHCV